MSVVLISIVVVAFIFGSFVGSFLNVCVHRLPRGESVVHPPSRCYSCGTRLTWYDNLPLFGWLLLRGRCRWCGTSFSVRYMLAELLVGALTAGAAWFATVTPSPWVSLLAPAVSFGIALASLTLLVWFLYVASMIDIDHQIIPDELTKSLQLFAPLIAVGAGTCVSLEEPLPMAWLVHLDVFQQPTLTPFTLLGWMSAIVGAAVLVLIASVPVAKAIYSKFTANQPWTEDDHRGFRLGVWWFAACCVVHLAVLAVLLIWQPKPWGVTAAVILAQAILGSLVGWFSLYLVGLLGTVAFRRNAMGFGDVKFLAPLGAFLGPLGVVYAFFAAAIIGTCVGIPMLLLRSTRVIPFGPYLALGTIAVLIVGGWIHRHLFAGIF